MDAIDITESRHHNHQHSQPQPRRRHPVKTGTWLPVEDVRLREAVAKYGTRWVRVAGEVGTRNGDQCAKRWNENLNPELDHSPWTPEEDERLLTMVEKYGRNWKFMADSFFELRAPLALKNRYSLLMRRLNRQGSGQQQATNIGDAQLPRHVSPSGPSSGSVSPSPNSTINSAGYFSGGRGPHSQHPDYATMSAASSNFSLSTGPFGAGMMTPSDATGTGGWREGRGGTALGTTTAATAATATAATAATAAATAAAATAAWDDQDLIWQQYAFLGAEMEPEGVSSGTGTNGGENEVAMMSDNSSGNRSLPQSGSGLSLRSAALSSDGRESGIAPAAEVEYSVTCQWGKLKTLMNHLVDAAMSESAEWTGEDDQVMITLRLKV